MNANSIPIELKKAICDNQLILFVGAGLSYNLANIKEQKIKGWSNLVEQILINLRSKGYDVDILIPLIKKYSPIKILDLLETDKDIPKYEIYNFVKDFFDLDEAKNDFELHKKLYKLSRKIITTNYDSAFEKAIPELRKNKAYKGKNYELTTHKDPNTALLFKLHGCFEDVDSMVLFPTNYQSLYQNSDRDAEHSMLVLKNIILNKSVLFIGTGLGDFQINNIFKEVKRLQGDYNQSHFVITTKPLESSLSFLTALYIKDHIEIEGVINELISIKENCENQESEEIRRLQEQLDLAKKEIESLRSIKSSNKDKLLEREALKYFSKGVELHLQNKPEDAINEYKTALELKPNLHEAIYSWGNALVTLAKTDKEKEVLYQKAFEKFQEAIEIKPDKHEAFNNWGTALGKFARTKEGKELEDLYLQSFEKFQKAIEIKPDKHEAFYNWGTSLVNFIRNTEGVNEEFFLQAFEKFQKTIEIKPDGHEAFNNWGSALVSFAKRKGGKEAEDLYWQAFEKFQKAIDIKPDKYQTFDNWGNSLIGLAEINGGDKAIDLLQMAIEKFKEALLIKPDYYESLYNLGIALDKLAKTKEGKEAEDLYNEALEKFQKAIEIKPDEHNAFNNWGTTLLNLARIKERKEAEFLHEEAFEKFQKALDLEPNKYESFNNWGSALVSLAKTKEGKEAEDMYQQGLIKLQKALEYGSRSYNLSCAFAIKGDKKSALKYLDMSFSNDEIKVEFVKKDEDWKDYLGDKEFIRLLEKYKK